MKKLPLLIFLVIVGIAIGFAVSVSTPEKQKAPTFEDAVAIIKKYEGLHSPKHWPLIGYGHKVMPGEKFSRTKKLSEAEADALLRKDYAKLCAMYRSYGADSLLLAALAYNCGIGVVAKSSVLSKLKAGNRDIEASYIAHSKYRGKQLAQLKRRREEELATLFVKNPKPLIQEAQQVLSEAEHIEGSVLSLDHPEQNDSVHHARAEHKHSSTDGADDESE